MKFTRLVLLFSLINLTGYSQFETSNQMFQFLQKSQKPLYIFRETTPHQIIPLGIPYAGHCQYILKTNDKIYIWVDGTGILYKLDPTINKFKRIDSTQFWGYNIAAFSFTYNDSVYNLGGAGIWRSNGHLRVFNNKAHEWDIVPLNKEIPLLASVNEGLIWYDIINSKIYCAFYIDINDGLKKNQDDDPYIFKVMELNLKTKNWSLLGELNEDFKPFCRQIHNIAMMPWGLLTFSNSTISLWDFKNNKFLKLSNIDEKYQLISREASLSNTICRDSTLLFFKNNSVDSVTLSYSEFTAINKSIYYKPVSSIWEKNRHIFMLIILIFLFVLSLLGLHFYKKSIIKHFQTKLFEASLIQDNLDLSKQIYNEQELLILRLLYDKSYKNKKVTTEEINNTLGLTNRSIDTQKQQRHKLITSINQKYSSKTGKKLISKEPSEFDKRVNEYFIPASELEIIKKVLI